MVDIGVGLDADGLEAVLGQPQGRSTQIARGA